jgi:hypothetical protein
MLFWIFVILFAGACIWKALDDGYNDAPFIALVVSSVPLIISILILMFSHIGVDGYIKSCHARYDMLVYQWENDIYENDNDYGKRELVCDIQAWNEDLSRDRENQDDFWIGIYYPNIYDQFEFISLSETQKEKE